MERARGRAAIESDPDLSLQTGRFAAAPTRGSPPNELRELGDKEYRQVFFKPYRVIYRVAEQQVIIYLTADGRRNMQTLLSRRSLGG